MKNPSVSIVIPVYNAQKTIKKCLEALCAQSYSNIEIIAVDDGSGDDSRAIIATFERVMYVYQENAGPAAARNAGARRAQGDIILFTDSDCLAHEDWASVVVAVFEDDSVAVVAGSYGIANAEFLLARAVHREILFRHQNLVRHPKVFGSYNFAIQRKVFEACGGFSCKYRQASGEDNDLSYRLVKAGYKIVFEARSLVDHFHPISIKKYLKEQFRHGFWRAQMVMDHPHMAKSDGYTCWKDVIEVPLTLSLIVFFCLSFFFAVMKVAAVLCLMALFLIECFFAFQIMKKGWESFFMIGLMGLRSFARSAGLVCGLSIYYFKSRLKK